jgi:glutathione-regulated potassium-efflux system ancillary protein KefC/glutathione-regulated potassium-efflux system protein KefB
MSLLLEAAVFLAAAVIAVPLLKRLGLGAVLGYLAAGVVIGPWVLGLVSDVDHILHFAEFGVVLLLFIIGLELQPARLWIMRKAVFGLGGAQVFVTASVLSVAGYALGLDPTAAGVVGLSLSLSSTAFALQTLAEKQQLTTRHGRTAFSILLLQDLAVIPMLAIVPLLGPQATGPMDSSGMIAAVQTVAIVLVVAVGGHYLLRPLLRIVAASGTREVFTAMALLTVVGTALLMESIGLSMALGAFLAGVLLADSEYRHALEADIEPFKGMLLGLFFIAVGMSLNVGLVADRPGLVLALVAGLIAIKFAVLFTLGRMTGLNRTSARSLAVAISQGGEFAFVIFGVAVAAQLLDQGLAELLIAVVTVSMAVTPLLSFANDTMLKSWSEKPAAREFEAPPENEKHVIIAGFGRFGQIVGRVLRAKKIPFTALEISPEQIDFVSKYGNKVYYGDASRLALLHAARAGDAAAFVLAIDDVEASLRTAETVRRHFPKMPVYARARDRKHAHQLMDQGVTIIRRETLHSSLDLAGALLTGLGLSAREAENAVETFRQHDEMLLFAHYWHHNDEEKMQALSKEGAQQLKELFEQDAAKDEAGE